MKKKIFSLFALVVMICSLTGCIKYNATMEIRKDKSMTFSIIYAMDNSILEMSDDKDNAIMSEEDKQSLINQGFTFTDYKDDKNTGFTISKEYPNIDDISSNLDTEYSLSNMFEETTESKLFKVVKGTNKNTYYANFKFDSSDANDDADESKENDSTTTTDEETTDLSKLGDTLTSSLDLKFIVKLPEAAISNNATEKSEDGKELTWKLGTNEQDIQFVFELENTGNSTTTADTTTSNNNSSSSNNEFMARFFNKANMPVIIGAGVVFLLAVIVVIILYVKANAANKKSKNNKESVTTSQNVATGTVVETASVQPESTVAPVETTPVTSEPVVETAPVQPEPIVAPVEATPVTSEPVVEPTPVQLEPTVAPVEVTPVTPEPAVEPTPQIVNPEVTNEQTNSDNSSTI